AETAGGLKWTAPASWKAQPERPMRAATYSVPKAAGDAEDGECAVFYFGTGQGGSVQANIERWYGQFETMAKPPAPREAKAGKYKVTYVEHSGSYKSGGPMMATAATKKAGFQLLGAIVEGPQGSVFFKLTGPAKTVSAAKTSFEKMLQGIQ
ncbi:MAG: hypothetical protein ABI972_25820, partial [Acidobacteriota bacterium]